MKGLLIFDQLNDLLFFKGNRGFVTNAWKLAKKQGLVPNDDAEIDLSANILIQLFSPIVTSQRIMTSQFGNSYSSIQCEDGTNMVFTEYMGYLLMQIGTDSSSSLSRSLNTTTTFLKHICGPNVPLLRSNVERSHLLSGVIDSWNHRLNFDQAVLIEAVEQLDANPEICAAAIKALKDATEKFMNKTEYNRAHALILVENKFLSLYSSRSSSDLSPADIIFLGILVESVNYTEDEFTFLSTPDVIHDSTNSILLKNLRELPSGVGGSRKGPIGINSYLILLSGNRPHAVHISRLADSVHFLLLFECGGDSASIGLNEAFHSFNALQTLQNQKDMENVNHAYHFLEGGMKKIFGGLKKADKSIEACLKNLRARWDVLKKKYMEFIKSPDPRNLMKIESMSTSFVECLRTLHKLTCLDESVLAEHHQLILTIHNDVKFKLQDFSSFLRVKALRNCTLDARISLSINKYLEEFPGLAHFLYVDRVTHRLTAPSLDSDSQEKSLLTHKRVWKMVEFARTHLQEGHLAMMWKDTTFNYAYFLWFEDSSGSPIKPKIYPCSVLKNCPLPGIMSEDFYRRLVEGCFPKISPNKVHVYELYCVHLGLATASCVLEHSRRLAATIWEVTGIPSNPADFL